MFFSSLTVSVLFATVLANPISKDGEMEKDSESSLFKRSQPLLKAYDAHATWFPTALRRVEMRGFDSVIQCDYGAVDASATCTETYSPGDLISLVRQGRGRITEEIPLPFAAVHTVARK